MEVNEQLPYALYPKVMDEARLMSELAGAKRQGEGKVRSVSGLLILGPIFA